MWKASWVWILGPQLVSLFWKTVELLGYVASVEEGYKRWALRFYNLVPFTVCFLSYEDVRR